MSENSEILMRVRNVAKSFSDRPAAEDVSFDVAEGRTTCLLGPSGCGKTTVLRLIAGLEFPDRGTIECSGIFLNGPGIYVHPEDRQMGMVFQEYTLFPHLTVEANIGFGLQGWSSRARKERLEEIYELLRLEPFCGRYPHELSGGQQQRVALGRALARKPRLLLLDEPFSNLDVGLRVELREELFGILQVAKMTTILVTHDQEEALSLGHNVVVMNEGRIVQQGSGEDIFYKPTSFFGASFLGHVSFVKGAIRRRSLITEFGDYPLEDDSHSFGEGEEAWLLIRPDEVMVTPNEQAIQQEGVPLRKPIRCALEKISLGGVARLASLKSPGGNNLLAALPGTFYPKPGDFLWATLLPRKTVAFKRSGTLTP